MTKIIELVKKFKTHGYELSVHGDKIRCTPKEGSRPVPSEVTPLLDLLKEHKAEVIEHLQQKTKELSVVDTIAKLFDGTITSVKPPETKDPSAEKKGFRGVYIPTQADLELDAYISKSGMNPNGYRCIKCGAIAGRYCLGEDRFGKIWWGWQCLKCRPYIEPERN